MNTNGISKDPEIPQAPSSATSETHEEAWEDVQDLNYVRPALRPARGGNPRRRRAGYKTTLVAQTAPSRKAATLRPLHQDAAEPPVIDQHQVRRALRVVAAFTIRYVGDVLTTAVRLLRKPLGILLFIWILGVLFTTLNHTFRTVFSPFCIIPGISRSALCITPQPNGGKKQHSVDFGRLMDVQGSTFEQLLDDSVDSSGLSLEIKKAEIATSDLIVVVRASNLKSKELLADTLAEFHETGKKAGRGLQTFAAKTAGAVDNIMAVNDFAMRQIEAANVKPSALSIVWPFSSRPQTKEVVLRTFRAAMDVLATNMQRLIIEAEANLLNLDRLEEILVTLHDIVHREDASISSAHSELLSELWTKLGGNKREVRSQRQHLMLLRNLTAYRSRALAHVVGALQTLQAMSADLEDLRERVAAPELMGEHIPLEVHMKSIGSGIERLKEGKMKAKERQVQVLRGILGTEDLVD
ncbi:hypothetical protein BKA93DRAFT_798035 [Sparassis latifolia]|uniref:Transmembrane protein n=1 Tax=Sparassis crispa TaxID=139825 RepID=A0A401H0I3_9APHY|nr:hypothetical protein SCP_1201270 [Sparassis crispa]GBE87902.1 hypothetical protein SCP_1201270 [Sparassis crispa]